MTQDKEAIEEINFLEDLIYRKTDTDMSIVKGATDIIRQAAAIARAGGDDEA